MPPMICQKLATFLPHLSFSASARDLQVTPYSLPPFYTRKNISTGPLYSIALHCINFEEENKMKFERQKSCRISLYSIITFSDCPLRYQHTFYSVQMFAI